MKIPVVDHSLKYNPSLDGLRGIAIVLVLLFHIWPQTFNYGFLGVDLFFLLSGYLITQIIYIKLSKKIFSFKEFYRNRIRRIFPAVIVVLFFILTMGYLFLSSSELKDLGRHIQSSAFFYENFRLIGDVGYWDKAAELKPTLHFWSLSIEEQFYLLWPFIIYVIYKLRLDLFRSLVTLFMLSLLFSLSLDIDRFYHFLARFWELILGGLLYSLSVKYNYSVSEKNRMLSFYPLVFLGLISFPLYLWHYAIISYMYILGLNVHKYGFVIIVVSIILAFLTYRYIEIYARRQKSYLFAFFLFITMITIGLFGNYIYNKNGFPHRSFLSENNKFQKQFIRESDTNKNGKELVAKIIGYIPKNDYIKATTNDINKSFLVIVGDSHAHTSYPGFAKLAHEYDLETLLVANSSCPPYINSPMGKNTKELKECKEKIDSIYKILDSKLKIKKVILATRANCYIYDIGYGVVDGGNKPYRYHYKEFFKSKENYNQKKLFFQNLSNTFSYFSRKQYEFYFLMEDPELGFSPKNCVNRPFGLFVKDCKLSLKKYLQRAELYRDNIYSIAKKYDKIHILDPKNLYCDNHYCYAIRDNKMLYCDNNHHSIDGSIMQAKYLRKKIFFVNTLKNIHPQSHGN